MGGGAAHIRSANDTDFPTLLALLLDDDVARVREAGGLQEGDAAYYAAFQDILNDTNNDLLVAEIGGEVVGFLQVTFIPGLSYQGGWRCLVEDVRVDSRKRRLGIGHRLMDAALERAQSRQCTIVELFMHSSRDGAAAFYEALGFEGQHRGYRLRIPTGTPDF